ncbi:hypothetical protein B0J11DRAFT_502641 [Dendryphion nanum]|uniref:Uncharacterized protein n=1 Tax=Dendryphion nanum TaxID=256645 RepID=A0A9P9EAS5_9PLEO|nr:hypothetical protein B0J11DRAFT_502641 [Dendryphion nanum]
MHDATAQFGRRGCTSQFPVGPGGARVGGKQLRTANMSRCCFLLFFCVFSLRLEPPGRTTPPHVVALGGRRRQLPARFIRSMPTLRDPWQPVRGQTLEKIQGPGWQGQLERTPEDCFGCKGTGKGRHGDVGLQRATVVGWPAAGCASHVSWAYGGPCSFCPPRTDQDSACYKPFEAGSRHSHAVW